MRQRVLDKSNAIRKCFNLHRNFVCHGQKGMEDADALVSTQLVKKEYFQNTSNPSSWMGAEDRLRRRYFGVLGVVRRMIW